MKSKRPASHLGLWLTTSCLWAQGPQLTIAEGASPTALAVRSFPEAAPTSAGTLILRDLEFLPLEITNRLSVFDLRPDRARRVVRDGLVRIELPGNGRLLRYRLRGGERYGFLLVLPDGAAKVVLELPGVGVSGKDDPYEDRIGVAPDGKAAGILTLAGAFYLARLDGQDYASSGTPARRVPASNGANVFSLCVGTSFAFYQEANRVWRCALADQGVPVDVTPTPLPAVLKDFMAPSGDGKAVAFLAGATKNTMQIWLVGASGTAVALPPLPSKFEEPAYLPEDPSGARLMLNDDATRLIYVDGAVRDELFLIDISGATSSVAMTADTNFQPYIGTIILPVFSANVVTAAIGDIGKHDIYTATTGQPAVANATQTGGNTVRPWGTGTLVPTGAFLAANGLVHTTDVDANQVTTLRTIQPATSTAVITAVGLRGDPQLGATWNGVPDVLVPTHAGDFLHDGASFVPYLLAPTGLQLSPTVRDPLATYLAFRVTLPGVAHALLVAVPSLGLFSLPPETVAPTFAVTVSGSLLVNTSTGFVFFSPAGAATLPVAGTTRHLLSGAGA